MADIIDAANEQADMLLSAAMRNRRRSSLPAVGNCHYCSEPCGSKLFCDTECRDGYEHEQRIRVMTGVAR